MPVRKRSVKWSYLALAACLIATICDLTSMIIFARYYPGYDSNVQPISALGASGSPIARIVSGWWIFLGLIFLIFSFAYGKSNGLHRMTNKVISWLIGVYAIGEEIGSGLFPGNHLAGRLTATGIVHNAIGGIGTIALVVIPFVLMKAYTREVHLVFNRFLLIISITGLIFFLLFSISRFGLPGMERLLLWHGLWQRLFVANYYVMLVAIAVKQVQAAQARDVNG